jgi:hypothetical protein
MAKISLFPTCKSQSSSHGAPRNGIAPALIGGSFSLADRKQIEQFNSEGATRQKRPTCVLPNIVKTHDNHTHPARIVDDTLLLAADASTMTSGYKSFPIFGR